MKGVKVFVVALMAAVASMAVGVVGASTAVAADNCTPEAGATCIVVEGLLTEKIVTEATAKTSQVLTIASISTTITCTGVAIAGGNEWLELKGAPADGRKIKLTYTGCSANEMGCKVSDEVNKTAGLIETNELSATVTLVAGAPDILFEPTTVGGTFVEIKVEGCLKAAKIPVSGTQLCGAAAAETESVTQELECTVAGSSLKDGTKTATYEGTSGVTLAAPNVGKKWGFLFESF